LKVRSKNTFFVSFPLHNPVCFRATLEDQELPQANDCDENNDASNTAAFSSFLRGIAKLRIALKGQGHLINLRGEERQRALRSTIVLDILQTKNARC